MIELGVLLMVLGLLGIAGAIAAGRLDRVRPGLSGPDGWIPGLMPAAGIARREPDGLGPVRRPVGARSRLQPPRPRPPLDGRPRPPIVRRDPAGC